MIELFDFDKIPNVVKVLKIDGKEYEVKKPTVRIVAEIHRLDDKVDFTDKLVELLIPDLTEEIKQNLALDKFREIIQLCVDVYTGDHLGKPWTLAEIKKVNPLGQI